MTNNDTQQKIIKILEQRFGQNIGNRLSEELAQGMLSAIVRDMEGVLQEVYIEWVQNNQTGFDDILVKEDDNA